MDAVIDLQNMGKVVWKLREVMARRKVSNKALAEKMGIHPTNISRIKAKDTLPAIGSEEIDHYIKALTELSSEDFGACTFDELIEWVD